VGAVVIHTDRLVDMMKLKVPFCDYADASKNAILGQSTLYTATAFHCLTDKG